jgi:hypothetical protein
VYAIISNISAVSTQAPRINETMFHDIGSTIEANDPSTFDLIPLNVTAEPTTIAAGGQLSELSYAIHNYSTASWSGTVNVDVYLSENDFISTSDTLLQTRMFTHTFGPKSTAVVTSSSGLPTVPSGISGDYYIGVILDVADYSAGNNASHRQDAQPVTVVNPCYSLARSHTGSGGDPSASLANSTGCPVGQYIAGEYITLTAFPDVGWEVGSWSGTDNDASTSAVNYVTMPGSSHVVGVDYVSIAACDVDLMLDEVVGGCSLDTAVTMSVRNPDCDLAGIQLAVSDAPDWVELVQCDALAPDFTCSFSDVGGVADIILVSLNGGLIPASVSYQDVATITYTGTAGCADDCSTDVALNITAPLVSDSNNDPAGVTAFPGLITFCPCGTAGDVNCDETVCNVFDVLEAINQALGEPEACEGDVSDCNGSVNIFDILCLIDCALARPGHCLVTPCTGSDLPSGCLGLRARPPVMMQEKRGGSARVVGLAGYQAGQARAEVHLEDLGLALKGVGMTFRIPGGWMVSGVELEDMPASFEVYHHQDLDTLRVIVLSPAGEYLAAGAAHRLSITMESSAPSLPRVAPQVELLAVEAADEEDRPVRLDPVNGHDRNRRAGAGKKGRD